MRNYSKLPAGCIQKYRACAVRCFGVVQRYKMASRRRGKRKSPCSDFIYEVNDGDLSPERNDCKENEPETKIFKKDLEENTESSSLVESNLGGDVTVAEMQTKVIELNNFDVICIEDDSELTNKRTEVQSECSIKDESTVEDSVITCQISDKVEETPKMTLTEELSDSFIVIDCDSEDPLPSENKSSKNSSVCITNELTEKIETVVIDTEGEEGLVEEGGLVEKGGLIEEGGLVEGGGLVKEGGLVEGGGLVKERGSVEEVSLVEEEGLLVEDEVMEVVDSTSCEKAEEVKTESDIVIKFRDDTISKTYKTIFLNFINTLSFSTIIPDELSIQINLNHKSSILSSPDNVADDKKIKKRKKKAKVKKDLFVVDPNPSEINKQPLPRYASKFTIENEEKVLKETEKKATGQTCFNCDGPHSLKDCTEPKDPFKINMNRQKFSTKYKNARYHLEEDQKYSHLAPGKISDALRFALGLRKNEIPSYIYEMRRLGYPPGWLEEAKFLHSNLSMFDIDGNNVREYTKKKQGLDPEKINDYPGFNVPLERGIKDEHRRYNVPPYSKNFSKENMINYFEEQFAKEQDDFEICDMDLDPEAQNIEMKKEKLDCRLLDDKLQRDSPSLGDLEKRKLELLAKLGDDNSDSNSRSSENEISEKCQTSEAPTGSSTPRPIVKTSCFGTPILKSASPFSRLPNPDNFQKDVSPVINFENLPNATGKYEQMSGILQKVRSTLKHLPQNCSS